MSNKFGSVKDYRLEVKRFFKEKKGISLDNYGLLDPERRGVFIRLDTRFKQTKKLFIQRGVKDFNGNFFSSGINNKEFRLLVQGCLGHWYIFDTDSLEDYFKSKESKLVKGFTKQGKTYYGSLLSLKKSEQLCVMHYMNQGKGNIYAQTKLL